MHACGSLIAHATRRSHTTSKSVGICCPLNCALHTMLVDPHMRAYYQHVHTVKFPSGEDAPMPVMDTDVSFNPAQGVQMPRPMHTK